MNSSPLYSKPVPWFFKDIRVFNPGLDERVCVDMAPASLCPPSVVVTSKRPDLLEQMLLHPHTAQTPLTRMFYSYLLCYVGSVSAEWDSVARRAYQGVSRAYASSGLTFKDVYGIFEKLGYYAPMGLRCLHGIPMLPESSLVYEEVPEPFSVFPEPLRWLWFIDGIQHAQGPLCFDTELNYSKSLYAAYHWMLQNISAEISVDYVCALHDRAVEGVCRTPPMGFNIASGYRTPLRETNFGICCDPWSNKHNVTNGSTAGMKEFRAQVSDPSSVLFSAGKFINTEGTSLRWELNSYEESEIREKVGMVLAQYHVSKNTEDPNERLRAVVVCCQTLERLHPFQDGNARTFGILLLNRLLIDTGLPPCIMADPNQLDACSVDEVVALVQEGQGYFEEYRRYFASGGAAIEGK